MWRAENSRERAGPPFHLQWRACWEVRLEEPEGQAEGDDLNRLSEVSEV